MPTFYGGFWFQHDYRGEAVDFHTGSLPGMVAIAGLIREENYLELEHWHFDTFRGQWPKPWYGKTNATFSPDGDAKIEKVSIMGLIYTKNKSEY